MAKLNLMAPWDEFYHEIDTFFKDDPDVMVLYDEDVKEVKLLVKYAVKAEALSEILIDEHDFGGVKLKVTVVPANGYIPKDVSKHVKNLVGDEDYQKLYCQALRNNENLKDVKFIQGVPGFNALYVIFTKRVLQYYADNLGDYNGMRSTLAENIARDIFKMFPGRFFCTDVKDYTPPEPDYCE